MTSIQNNTYLINPTSCTFQTRVSQGVWGRGDSASRVQRNRGRGRGYTQGPAPPSDSSIQRLEQRFDQLNQRFDQLNQSLDQRFDQIDQRLDQLDYRLQKLTGTLSEVAIKPEIAQLKGKPWVRTVTVKSLDELVKLLGPCNQSPASEVNALWDFLENLRENEQLQYIIWKKLSPRSTELPTADELDNLISSERAPMKQRFQMFKKLYSSLLDRSDSSLGVSLLVAWVISQEEGQDAIISSDDLTYEIEFNCVGCIDRRNDCQRIEIGEIKTTLNFSQYNKLIRQLYLRIGVLRAALKILDNSEVTSLTGIVFYLDSRSTHTRSVVVQGKEFSFYLQSQLIEQ